MMHFPPCFRFPPIFEEFSGCGKFSTFYLFPKKFSNFIRQNKFLMTFFSHRPQIYNFPPIFPVSVHFPLFRENYYFPPTFTNSPLCFRKIHLLFTYFFCISFPPTLTMMHLCIIQCTYWTPLILYFAALCLSDISPLARPISISNDSIVLFAVQETLSILLQVHISQTSIFFQDYSLLKPRTLKLICPLASLGT